MNFDPLYELMYTFSQDSLWQDHANQVLYAVTLTHQRIAYCLMHDDPETKGLFIYIDEDGIRTYYESFIYHKDAPAYRLDLKEDTTMLYAAFSPEDCLPFPDEIAQVRRFERSYQRRFPKKLGIPFLHSKVPFQPDYLIRNPQDAIDIYMCLDAYMQCKVEAIVQSSFKFYPLRPGTSIPLMTSAPGGHGPWSVSTTVMPPYTPHPWPKPVLTEPDLIARLQRLPSAHTFEMIACWMPLLTDSEDKRYYPSCILTLDLDAHQIHPTPNAETYEKTLKHAYANLLALFEDQKFKPSIIHVEEDRTYRLLEDFCEKGSIQLKRVHALQYAPRFLEKLYDDQRMINETGSNPMLDRIYQIIRSTPDEDIENIPEAVLDICEDLLRNGHLPEDVRKKLRL